MKGGGKSSQNKRSQDDNSTNAEDKVNISNPKETTEEEIIKRRKTMHAPTVREIVTDSLTHLSLQYWAQSGPENQERKPFDANIIEAIYTNELIGRGFDLNRIMLLEVSHYLENYLWKNFDAKTSSFSHLMSIIVMVNEKFREGVQAWETFHTREDVFPLFFERVLEMHYDKNHEMSTLEKTTYLVFLINCFQSLEDPMVRKEASSLVSLPLWTNLNPERLKEELKSAPKIARHWENFLKKSKGTENDRRKQLEKSFIVDMIQDFYLTLNSITSVETAIPQKVRYCERFVEFMLDLISQLPTRRLFHIVFQELHVLLYCEKSILASLEKAGKLFRNLIDMLKFYDGFEINNYTGQSLSEEDISDVQANKVNSLQRIAFKYFQEELRDLALSNSGSIENRQSLTKHLSHLSDTKLHELAQKVGLIDEKETFGREFLMEIIVYHYEKRLSHLESINETSIYPTEDLLWDDDMIPTDEYNGEHCLALPKLNLQFLTFHDYLLRNYDLFRLESCYEIRSDLEDSIRRINARKESGTHNGVKFLGWSRMALPIKEFSVTHVGTPKLGETKPSEVNAEIQFSLEKLKNKFIRDEWENIHQHDILFLVTLAPKYFPDQQPDTNLPFLEQYGVKYIRGCEVKEMLDEAGHLIRDFGSDKSKRVGDVRSVRVQLDAAQYQFDMTTRDEDVYGTFNVLIRRKPKENNFKAVLETIRDLMNTKASVPDWLHDVFLGYGDPKSTKVLEKAMTINFNDTFLDSNHLIASFPGQSIKLLDINGKETKEAQAPYKITFPPTKSPQTLVAQSYTEPRSSPFPFAKIKRNKVPFTPAQVEAIRSGISDGLTLVVGPPGTGKTDVAVQIINNWYHNFPEQRTLLVTHSNQALNQLFEKLIELDIDERHFVRLGHGEEQLSTEKDFGKYGRVNYMLSRRIDLLGQVEVLARSVGEKNDVSYTCEVAEQYYLSKVKTTINTYLELCRSTKTPEFVVENFPYIKFFTHAVPNLFPETSTFEQALEIAETCCRYITRVFNELSDCRPYEVLRHPYERANFLVVKQARIVAMTCTHAALKRADLVKLGFQYDNVLMEEAAQILEIETFIPLLLQQQEHSNQAHRLKRCVLIGDHHQLPPVVKNISFQKYSHLDQSLFTRFVRLGVPLVQLDAQGRARPSIASLYNWRYKDLKDLPITHTPEYHLANPGLKFDYQVVNVEDYEGKGESQPTPFFYQNLGEAEYVVALYMYMRLLGYPKEKISILTTYNGQKQLIRDVVGVRCANNPIFGSPAKITTVDRFQGQQNDYIILSLVRTSAVGHLRDIRRLVVAMSRARLGLYVFCRQKLFENCYELTQTFAKFKSRSNKLTLVENEQYPTTRKINDKVESVEISDVYQLGTVLTKLQPIAQQRFEKELEEKRIEAEKKAVELQKKMEAERAEQQEKLKKIAPIKTINSSEQEEEEVEEDEPQKDTEMTESVQQ